MTTYDRRSVLDCLFCGRYFDDFTTLALHVQRQHNTPDRASGSASSTQTRNGVTMKKATKKKSDRPAFLTPDDLNGSTPVEVKIGDYITTYVRDDNTTSLFVEVDVPRVGARTLSVRCAGPDRITMQEQCGRNLIDWPGQKIKVYVAEGSRGGEFINVHDPKRARRN